MTEQERDELFFVETVCFGGEWTQQMLFSEVDSPLCVLSLCKREGVVVGFALGRIAADEGELFQIAVLPDFRRQGIARELLSDFSRQMKERGAVCIFLEVRSRNHGAIALYESAGYEKISLRRGYYNDDDALIYKIQI